MRHSIYSAMAPGGSSERRSAGERRAPTVLVVDDEEIIASSTSRFLRARGYRVPLHLLSLDALPATILSEQVSVVVLDVRFANGESSIPILRHLTQQFPDTRFIIYTGYPDLALIHQVLRDGALGYLVKAGMQGLDELVPAIESVLIGQPYVTRFAGVHDPAVFSASRGDPWEEDLARVQAVAGFSRILAEVAVLKHAGFSEKQIATRLGISLHTVNGRLRRIYHEHGVHGMTELILLVERALRS